MNKNDLISYLEAIDHELASPATLYIYGSAACILLDEPERTSIDVDVAGPYSKADRRELRSAAERAGLPINPDEAYTGNHIEWVGPLRLCLQPPVPGTEITLWQGTNLCIQTAPVPELIASKLIRYDEIDQSDIQYLVSQSRATIEQIQKAASRLPPSFADDPLVHENLRNLEADMKMWGSA